MVAPMVVETLGGTAPLLWFSLLLLLEIGLRFLPSHCSPKKRVSAQDAEFVRQIKQLNRQPDALNTPATFAKSSKLRRAAVAKEKERAAYGDCCPRIRRMVQAETRGFCSSFSTATLRTGDAGEPYAMDVPEPNHCKLLGEQYNGAGHELELENLKHPPVNRHQL